MNFEELSTELLDLAYTTLDLAISRVRVTDGGPILPFAIIERGDSRELVRFVTDTYEDSKTAGEKHLAEVVDADRCTLAWDGYLTLDGQRKDAVFVRAHEATQQSAVLFAQRYAPAAPFDELGNSVFLGADQPLFTCIR
ncbi:MULTISPECIES: hypothetical protein [Micromonospora]|uniref:Uncharacterized protein n=1 Tax=Micromonospora sicca TaxID=2202420 RepID=A0A317DA56_9ACTN|nr:MULTISPECIES: hypothetical protein [unclassified Micromonospora]MBM0228457.1 hypothetical protein [Micromonospora sp. ATA51]PWR11354.1 hypothetical protein DKT69_26885 [Micromonospora sp. 4G51]